MDVQTDLLNDIHEEFNYEEVSAGTRFLDYLIDLIIFYILIFAVRFLFATIIYENGRFVSILISYMVYLIYYTSLEGATGGRTVGKMITGSIAIKDDGTAITWNEALKRSLSRIAPFEPFSGFGGHPWHDTWTNTKVVKHKTN